MGKFFSRTTSYVMAVIAMFYAYVAYCGIGRLVREGWQIEHGSVLLGAIATTAMVPICLLLIYYDRRK